MNVCHSDRIENARNSDAATGAKFTFIFKLPPYELFYQNFLLDNIPCILSCGLTDGWEATKNWVNASGEPYLDRLCVNYGELEVPVANCSQKYFDSQPKTQQKFKQYVSYMKQRNKEEILYLKDWHFQGTQRRLFPSEPAVYRTPSLFASDWLNEFWEARPERQDDYRFVYMGVAGSWTPFHADVFRSFSWSANVCGRKRWILLPPGEEEKLRSVSGLPYDVAGVLGAESHSEAASAASVRDGRDAAHLEPTTAPNGIQYYDVIQDAGEVMFVPSGWHHQVWNLRNTISINHNWLNGANIDRVCDHLMACLSDVKAELADIADGADEWFAQCQTLLRATHGMDLRECVELLCFVMSRRLEGMGGCDESALEGLDGWPYGRDLLMWDLRRAAVALCRLLDIQEAARLPEVRALRPAAETLLADAEAVRPPE